MYIGMTVAPISLLLLPLPVTGYGFLVTASQPASFSTPMPRAEPVWYTAVVRSQARALR